MSWWPRSRSRRAPGVRAAHIPREEIGGSYFQETHPQELFRECSVYAELVGVPEQLPRVLEIAMRFALKLIRFWMVSKGSPKPWRTSIGIS